MTQEQKELLDMKKGLLIKDLSARVPYGVKYVRYSWNYDTDQELPVVETLECVDKDGYINHRRVYTVDDIKPFLFPLSSMTNELWVKEFSGFGITRDFFEYGCESLEFNDSNPDLLNMVGFINQLIRNHFDIYGLIPMGLAKDATGLNIY